DSVSSPFLLPLSCPVSAPPSTSTRSLHDALPIFRDRLRGRLRLGLPDRGDAASAPHPASRLRRQDHRPASQGEGAMQDAAQTRRSEEHTSELQSRFDLVCRLLLEKKKKNTLTSCI